MKLRSLYVLWTEGKAYNSLYLRWRRNGYSSQELTEPKNRSDDLSQVCQLPWQRKLLNLANLSNIQDVLYEEWELSIYMDQKNKCMLHIVCDKIQSSNIWGWKEREQELLPGSWQQPMQTAVSVVTHCHGFTWARKLEAANPDNSCRV